MKEEVSALRQRMIDDMLLCTPNIGLNHPSGWFYYPPIDKELKIKLGLKIYGTNANSPQK
jgi:hypothetical protein